MPSSRSFPGQPTLLLLFLLCFGTVPARAAQPDEEGVAFFEKKVRPVLVEHCYRCHAATAKKVRGGLVLDSREGLLRGGESGPVLAAGKPHESRLIEAISYRNVELQMPPRGKLSEAAIADLTTWVRQGAPWPAQVASSTAGSPGKSFDLLRRKQEHWAWQPIQPRRPPSVRLAAWPRNAVDSFILARLEAQGLSPAAEADRRALLRRVYFDLVGLPPTPEEIEDYLRDESPEALARVVDRLLASPHFGERWARHWLDLVRYAESRGHEYDYTTPNAYQYRDYVIRAFNADLPYNQFVTEQVAGDLLPTPRRHPTEGFNESVLGTGFWLLGEEVHSPVDVRQDEADRLDNMVDVFGKTFLGLTIACARCHDHKFDAVSTRDYYSLLGFLESSTYRLARFDTMEHNRSIARDLAQLRAQGRLPLGRALAEVLQPGILQTGAYLLAAREVLLGGAASEADRVAACAAVHKLDPERLARWVAQLKASCTDANDSLQPLARLLVDPHAASAPRRAELVQQLAASCRGHDEQNASAAKNTTLVVDYAHPGPDGWLADGDTFGMGPVQPGELQVSRTGSKPLFRMVESSAAEKDSTWNGLKSAPGVENDPGALGRVMRAGRTIRTPSFTLTTGKVYFRVRGNGFIYAAVQSHHTIAGPLHGRLTRDVRAGPRFRWEEYDLTPYRGDRAHLEFTPLDGGDFALAAVVQADRMPADLPRPSLPVLELLQGSSTPSLAALADGWESVLRQAARRLAEDSIQGRPDAQDQACLVSWMLRHGALFGLEEETASRRLAEAALPFLAAQAQLEGRIRKESRLAPVLMEGGAWDEHVFIRGAPRALGPLAPRRFIEAFAGPEPLAPARGSGRLELARQLTDSQRTPLVSRVLVNRVWHHLFGRGIVASTDNFGVLGERPSHPELLDYLADRFVRDGWSVKKLIRLLVLSSTYRMASQQGRAADQVDPGNQLLHRMRLRRLEGEVIRDAMLALAGRLKGQMYGPSVPVHLTDFQEGRGRPSSGPLDGAGRRSIYLSVRRNFLSPLLLAFDTPSPFSSMGRRTVSNVPAQALILLNDDCVHEQAQRWAQRILSVPGTPDQRITLMYQQAFARPPRPDELTACRDFLDQQARRSGRPAGDPAIWTDLAHVLFNVKEFIFLP